MLTIVYENEWSTHEDNREIRIFEDINGTLLCQIGGYSPMMDPKEPYWNDMETITFQEALDLIDEWEEEVSQMKIRYDV